LYDQYNCRTLEDVREHYEAVADESPEVREKEKVRRRLNGGMKQVEIVEAWMVLKEELDQPYVPNTVIAGERD
jgi:DNA polymerase mu